MATELATNSDKEERAGFSNSENGLMAANTDTTLSAASLHRSPIDVDNEDTDRIERYLQHLKHCCKNSKGFDVYQVLAFRRLNLVSHKRRQARPFRLLLCSWFESCGLRVPSVFLDSLFTAIIIGLLQVVGITVILIETMSEYFSDNGDDRSACEASGEAWSQSWHYKMLAMLFAAMISMQLNKIIHVQKHSGFTEALSTVPSEQYGQLFFVDIAIVQLGLLINVYTLFCAVIGSIFLVYASEGGDHALEMVFNSISLFFMVGLDDLLVASTDYEDVEDYVEEYYQLYMENKMKHQEFKSDINKQCCGHRGLSRCDTVVDTIQFVLLSVTHFAGIIAPIAIAICW